FLVHAGVGISIWMKRRKAKPVSYDNFQSKGGPSHINWSSRSAIFTGIVLLVFLVIHLINFKFAATETIMIDGQQARYLKKLVIAPVQNRLYAFGYTLVMLLLGFYVADGSLSAITSIGMKRTGLSNSFYVVSIIFAILMAI